MVAVVAKAMRGEVPRTSERLLAPNFASRAHNCKITSGRLDPLRGLLTVYAPVSAAIKSLFRYRFNDRGQALDYWLTFASRTDVALNPIGNDFRGRFYFASEDHVPRMSTHADAIVGAGPYPAAFFALGLPNPNLAPAISVSGGTGSTELRAYVYTFRNRLGEETGPSPGSNILEGAQNGSWTVADMQTTLPVGGGVSAAVPNTPVSGQVTVTLDSVLGIDAEERITFAGVTGMTELNGTFRVVSVDLATSKIVVQAPANNAYISGGTWVRQTPHNTTDLVKRIYRSAGTGGQFFYVDEVPLSQASYIDTKPASQVNDPIATQANLPPPRNLSMLCELPNGCLAGIAGNQLCLSAPYEPASWPLANRYSFAGQGKGLGPAGSSVIVLTENSPILFSGTDPEAMSPADLETYAPCVSTEGVVNVGGALLYPSFDGLWLVGPGRIEKITGKLYLEDEWSRLNPTSFVAEFHDGRYHAAYTTVSGEERRIWVLHVTEPDSATEVIEDVDALHRNRYDGKLYVTQGNLVRQWDAVSFNQYPVDWLTPDVQLPRPINFAAAQVHADFDKLVPINADQLAANEALMADIDLVGGALCANEILAHEVCGSMIVPVVQETTKKVQFTLYYDKVPIFTKEVTQPGAFRLPGGMRTELLKIGINASVSTYSVAVAESMAELKQVA